MRQTGSRNDTKRQREDAGLSCSELMQKRLENPALRKLAEDGYEVFFNTFVKEDPDAYISFQTFCYKHFGNPRLLDEPAVIEYAGGKPVSMIWHMEMPFLVNGEKVTLASGGDYCATEAGRGLVAMRTLADAKDSLRRQSIPLRYGCSGDQGYAVGKRFGYCHLQDLPFYARKPGFDAASPPVCGSGSTARIEVSTSQSCPFSEEDYDEMNLSDDRIKPMRGPKFYEWRTDGVAHRVFSYVVAREGRRIGGFLVAEHMPSSVRIVDWRLLCNKSREDDVFASLLAALPGDKELTVRSVNPAAGESDLLEKAGFEPMLAGNGNPLTHRFCVIPGADDIGNELTDASKWLMREIDFDYHLNTHVVR